MTTTLQCSTASDCPATETCETLVIVREEHPTGWMRPDCFTCHEVRNIHTVNRTGLQNLDLAAIRAVTRREGVASCAQCHGTNGVVP